MGWRTNDSAVGCRTWDTEPMARDDILCRNEELEWIKRHQRKGWKLINGRIAQSGDPVAVQGSYGGVLAYPPAQALTAVTGGTTNVAWWTPTTYSPIPANSVMAPEGYRLEASGTITTTGAQTVIMNPAIGTAVAGVALGASATLTGPSTITGALWKLFGDLTIRTAGTAGTAYGTFLLVMGTTAGATPATPTATNPSHWLFGYTVATVDWTAAQGLLIAATPSAAGVSVTPQQVHWTSWN